MNSKSLVVSRPDPKTTTVPAAASVPDDLRLTLERIVDNPNLPYTQRRRLLKIETIGRCQLLKNEMDARVRVEQGRLAKSEEVALAAISAYGDKLIYQIRDEFTKTMRKWGVRVNVEQLELLADFGEQLTAFKAQLRTRGIETFYMEYILKSADGAFEMVAQQLGNLAGRMFDAVQKQTEADEA
jgi:hypothetical protein